MDECNHRLHFSSLRQRLTDNPQLQREFAETEQALRHMAAERLRIEGDSTPSADDYRIIINARAGSNYIV